MLILIHYNPDLKAQLTNYKNYQRFSYTSTWNYIIKQYMIYLFHLGEGQSLQILKFNDVNN